MAHAVFFNRPSRSGVRLAKALDATIIKSFKDLLEYINKNPTATILNWGVSDRPEWSSILKNRSKIKLIGHPQCVRLYSNKEEFNCHYENFVAVGYSTQHFVPKGVKEYVGRKTLKGSGGKGIFFFRRNSSGDVEVYDFDERKYEVISINDFKEYIKFAKSVQDYVPKTNEYRFFVGTEGIIGIIEKRKGKEVNTENAAPDLPMANYLRNHTNGYVFCKQGLLERNPRLPKIEEFVKENLIPNVINHNMWLVAFDIGYNRVSENITVYEGNTAPGLMSDTTLEDVVSYLKRTHLKHIFEASNEKLVTETPKVKVKPVSLDINYLNELLANIQPESNQFGNPQVPFSYPEIEEESPE